MTYYEIDNTVNLDSHDCFKSPDTYPHFQEQLNTFKKQLVNMVNNGESKTFYKFGDGDYFFLNKESIGSAAIGGRALSKTYDEIKHEEFVSGVCENDFITVELYPEKRSYFKNLYPNRDIDYPSEYSYGLVSSRWLTETFAGKIGLIGAKEKITLIQAMMKHPEYQDYLGLKRFEDYLCIPQNFACDDIDATEKMIAEQLVNSKSKIFLLGIGHVKSALLHRLKKYKNAVFLDVGSGVDALSGIIDHKRPYMGDWINYRVRGFDYSSLDILQYDIWNTPHKVIGE